MSPVIQAQSDSSSVREDRALASRAQEVIHCAETCERGIQ